MAAELYLYSLYLLLWVINFPNIVNTRQFNANQQIKTALPTNGIILTKIHWKISINFLINSPKHFTVYINQLIEMKILYVIFLVYKKFSAHHNYVKKSTISSQFLRAYKRLVNLFYWWTNYFHLLCFSKFYLNDILVSLFHIIMSTQEDISIVKRVY